MNAVPPADAGLVMKHTVWGTLFMLEMDATDGMDVLTVPRVYFV